MTTQFMKRVFGIYDFIDMYKDQYGITPTRGEMAAQIGVHPETLSGYLGKMERMGMIERLRGRRRGIRLITRKANWNALVTPEPGEQPPLRIENPRLPIQKHI